MKMEKIKTTGEKGRSREGKEERKEGRKETNESRTERLERMVGTIYSEGARKKRRNGGRKKRKKKETSPTKGAIKINTITAKPDLKSKKQARNREIKRK